MISRAFASAVCALILAALSPFAGTRASADATALTLQGIVADSFGHPVAGAFVSDGTTVQTDARGQYSLQIQPSDTSATVWAPGYNEEQLELQLPGGLTSGEAINFDFSGSFGLSSAFVDPQAHASLRGLPTMVPASESAVHISGTSNVPLESHVYVTAPNGQVHIYGLQLESGSFSARLPFQHDGAYRVEINATSGFSLFNVLVFRGVAPFLPTDIAASDPAGATPHQLASFALHLINVTRHQAGLPALHMQRSLNLVASAHNNDIVTHHYFLEYPHIGSDGSTPWDRVRAAVPNALLVGETVGEAQTVGEAVQSLLDSPSHRAILLGHFRWAGVSIARDGDNYLITVDLVN